MTTIYRDDEWDVLASHAERINSIEQGCPPYIEPPNSQLNNGWTQAFLTDPQWEPWGYRVCDGQLEFKGHLAPGILAASAYTLPAFYRILPGNPTWVSHMISGGTFVICHIKVTMNTGDVFIYPNTP